MDMLPGFKMVFPGLYQKEECSGLYPIESTELSKLSDFDIESNESLHQKIEMFFNVLVEFKLKYNKLLNQPNSDLNKSDYSFEQHFRDHLMKHHGTCCIIKDESAKLYSKDIYNTKFNFMGLNGDFSKIKDINILDYIKTIDDQHIKYCDAKFYEQLDGTNFSLSFNSTDDNGEISFNTKKGDGSNNWNSNKTVREQAYEIFEQKGINFDKIKEIMSLEENKHLRIVMNWITCSKESSFCEVDCNKLVSVYIINENNNPFKAIKQLFDEFIKNIESDSNYTDLEKYQEMNRIINIYSKTYVRRLNIFQFKEFLNKYEVGCVDIVNEYKVNSTTDYLITEKSFNSITSTIPYTMKGLSIVFSNKIYNFEFSKYKYAASFRPNMSIHINGQPSQEDFLSKNYNLFVFWIMYMMKIYEHHSDDESEQIEYQISICRDFNTFFGDKYKTIFDMFNQKLRGFSTIVWNCYKGNKISKTMKEPEFPICVKTDDLNSDNNLIHIIHYRHYKPNKTLNQRFSINKEFIYNLIIKDFLRTFLKYAHRPHCCPHGNLFENIIRYEDKMGPSIKLTTRRIEQVVL